MDLMFTPFLHGIFQARIKKKSRLWTSFVLQTPTMKIFIGGDSGYDKHFPEIGKTFGGFDLVILENGQYDKSWKHIHLMPEEILKVTKELNTKNYLPLITPNLRLLIIRGMNL